ncbi:MAG: Uncharacterised protein [Opitutia bacterium UBA7350]|nr:MAG: Uncharacterised protein [Opitutae bacterium UBA7350]
MELLNISFAILLVKLCISVLPIVGGCYLLFATDEAKREMRTFVCRSLFNINNAIPMRDFNHLLRWVGGLVVFFGLLAGWFLVLLPFFK